MNAIDAPAPLFIVVVVIAPSLANVGRQVKLD
jgi:hypothetical protein